MSRIHLAIEHGAGVQRQYTGSAGKIASCQVGTGLTVATRTEDVPSDVAKQPAGEKFSVGRFQSPIHAVATSLLWCSPSRG